MKPQPKNNLIETLTRLSKKHALMETAHSNCEQAIEVLKNKNPDHYKSLFGTTPRKNLIIAFKNSALIFKSIYFTEPYIETTLEVYISKKNISCSYSLVSDLEGTIIDDYLIY